MPERVFLARNPARTKVTTIDIRLGAQAIPYLWEYIIISKGELPAGKLKEHWESLSANKKILISEFNKDKATFKAVLKSNSRLHLKMQSLKDHRQTVLNQLDIAFIRSMELPTQDKAYRQEAIGKFKEDLRALDVTAKSFENDNEYLSYWPAVFDRSVQDYVALRPKKILWIPIAIATALSVLFTIIIALF